jgi:hypothetical protein
MTVPAAGAWLDASVDDEGTATREGGPGFGRYTHASCESYTSTSAAFTATVLLSSGEVSFTSTCSTARSLACCY